MGAPIKVIKAGSIQVAIFKNTFEKDGKPFDTFSVSATKTYKSGEEFKTTTSFNPNELPKVMLLLQKAYEELTINKEA